MQKQIIGHIEKYLSPHICVVTENAIMHSMH